MNERDAGRVIDIRVAVQKIVNRVGDLTKEEFDQDETLQLAITHLVQIIGEAASRLSEDFRDDHPSVEWRKVISMRHRLVHDYNQIDTDIIWEVANRHAPQLLSQLPEIDALP